MYLNINLDNLKKFKIEGWKEHTQSHKKQKISLIHSKAILCHLLYGLFWFAKRLENIWLNTFLCMIYTISPNQS